MIMYRWLMRGFFVNVGIWLAFLPAILAQDEHVGFGLAITIFILLSFSFVLLARGLSGFLTERTATARHYWGGFGGGIDRTSFGKPIGTLVGAFVFAVAAIAIFAQSYNLPIVPLDTTAVEDTAEEEKPAPEETPEDANDNLGEQLRDAKESGASPEALRGLLDD